jgi:hypothetical protein
MTMRLTSTCVLVLSVLVFAGAAYAGNGNGNGKGSQSDAPANSANAPGQLKKDSPSAAAETTTTTTPTAAVTTPVATTTTTAAAPNETGVKPSSTTAHDTHAQAQSDKTKQYGNGQTAGQIAEKNGAAGKDVLHGPGNSQPHKLAPCSGGHEVDVHALKSHRSGSCDRPAPAPQPTPAPGSNPPSQTTTTTTTTTTEQPKPTDPGSQPASGEAPGVVATRHGHAHGVLAATQRIGQVATLPFTGQRLWFAALLGLMLIGTGLALRAIQTAEAPVESGHDHTDRSRHAARSARAPVGGGPGR